MIRILRYRKFILTFICYLLLQSCNNDHVSLAVVETSNITEVTDTSAVSGGNVISEGSDIVTARGVCWGTNQKPTTSDAVTTDGSGKGSFTSRLVSLNPGTTYYVRAYATNASGTAYGVEKTFKSVRGQIIADHTVIADFNKIPARYISEVKKMMVSFRGESHGVAYQNGLVLLNEQYPAYACSVDAGQPPTDQYLRVERLNWIGEKEWFTWLSYAANSVPPEKDYIKNYIKSYADAGHPISVLGFAWCWDHTNGGSTNRVDSEYGVSWFGFSVGGPDGNTCWGLNAEDFALTDNHVCMDTYLNATLEYINYCKTNNYPTKIVFTTCPVDNNGDEGLYSGAKGYQGHIKQEYIRNFVRSDTSRILFDYADILCYDDDGKQTTSSWNGHTFPSIAPANLGDASIGHIGPAGALRLAKAQWWLLARIAGWDGK